MKRICVFCGSNVGNRTSYADAARELARELAKRQLGLVYGGGHLGLMGLLADAALASGVEVTGVITDQLQVLERGHTGLSLSHIVATMHERKAKMASLSDGFIALPGGFGTFEELCEMITWTQLRIHSKPAALVNIEGFYDPLLAQFDRAVEDGLLRPENRAEFITASSPADALDQIAAWQPDEGGHWFKPPQP